MALPSIHSRASKVGTEPSNRPPDSGTGGSSKNRAVSGPQAEQQPVGDFVSRSRIPVPYVVNPGKMLPSVFQDQTPHSTPVVRRGLQVLEVWKSYGKEGEKSQVSESRGVLSRFFRGLEDLYGNDIGTAEDRIRQKYRTFNLMGDELKKRLLSGRARSLLAGLQQLASEGHRFYQPLAREILGEGLAQRGRVLLHLVEASSRKHPVTRSLQELMRHTFEFEADNGVVETPLRIYHAVLSWASDAKTRRLALKNIDRLTGKSDFGLSLSKVLFQTSAAEVAVDVAMIAASAGVGAIARKTVQGLLKHQAAKGLARAATTGIGVTTGLAVESGTLTVVSALRDAAIRDPGEVMKAEHLKASLQANLFTLGGLRIFGAIGKAVGGKIVEHAFGLAGMLSTSRAGQALGILPASVGGENDWLARELVNWAKLTGGSHLAGKIRTSSLAPQIRKQLKNTADRIPTAQAKFALSPRGIQIDPVKMSKSKGPDKTGPQKQRSVLRDTTPQIRAGQWTFEITDSFKVPDQGPDGGRSYLIARVPVQEGGKTILKRRVFYRSLSSGGRWRVSIGSLGGVIVKRPGSVADMQVAPELAKKLTKVESRMTSTPPPDDAFNIISFASLDGRDPMTTLVSFLGSSPRENIPGMTAIGRDQPGKVFQYREGRRHEGPLNATEIVELLKGYEFEGGRHQNFIPDFRNKPFNEYREPTNLGKTIFRQYTGHLNGEVVVWTMAETDGGRTWVESIHYRDHEITSYGTPERVPNLGILVYKPLEYKHQTNGLPEGFTRPFGNNTMYVDITPMLNLLRPLRDYRRARNLPEDLPPIFSNTGATDVNPLEDTPAPGPAPTPKLVMRTAESGTVRIGPKDTAQKTPEGWIWRCRVQTKIGPRNSPRIVKPNEQVLLKDGDMILIDGYFYKVALLGERIVISHNRRHSDR